MKKTSFYDVHSWKNKIKVLSLHSLLQESIQADSLAQQVEHIPFKDGVLGSSPRRITNKKNRRNAVFFIRLFPFYFPQVFHLLSGQESVDIFEVFGHFLVTEFIHFFSQAIQKIPVV